MSAVLDSCRAVCGSGARFTWVSGEFLVREGVAPYTEMPLWVPGKDETVACGKATAAGLAFRPLTETIHDTLAWDRTRPPTAERIRGLRPEREQALLRAWNARQGRRQG